MKASGQVCAAYGASLIFAIGLIGFSAIAAPARRLFFNPSASAPRGWYWQRSPAVYATGMRVFAALPEDAALLAEERRYLPREIPVLKRIVAGPADTVCERQGEVRINGHLVARALPEDRLGRPLTPWQGCRVLTSKETFLLSLETPASFDSRYFGPLPAEALRGQAIALWTW
jgi:conjugative transfer signal peptidase TraF